MQRIVRQVEEPRYVVHCVGELETMWYVWDRENSVSVDSDLFKDQAKEMAALRNKWDKKNEGE